MAAPPTYLAFQHNGQMLRLQTTVLSVQPVSALDEASRSLFKHADDADLVVTRETIFHPQGGGQPSDEGTMAVVGAADAPVFHVRAARIHAGQVLHLGRMSAGPGSGSAVEQAVDADKRLLYSRLHTAGHVLGAAVRNLLQHEVPGFDKLKASHGPGSAACEFRGAIDGRWREPIQRLVAAYEARAMPVEVALWTEDDFRRRGLERLLPDRALLPPGEDRFRVVRIGEADVYPCGGTHVERTDLCGPTLVKKISRAKGTSRVSYSVA